MVYGIYMVRIRTYVRTYVRLPATRADQVPAARRARIFSIRQTQTGHTDREAEHKIKKEKTTSHPTTSKVQDIQSRGGRRPGQGT